jgi:DNA-damage-inducible protein D
MKILPTQFEGQDIRRVYDEATETWWFSAVDVVQVLTQQADDLTARKYWNQLKRRLDKEGSQLVTACHQLKMPAADGKQRLTDVATAQTLLRLVQSVPSPKAEPQGRAHQTLAGQGRLRAHAGNGRPGAVAQPRAPDLATTRPQRQVDSAAHDGPGNAQQAHRLLARPRHPGRPSVAILTNIIHQKWSGVSVKDHKKIKGLKSHNLRDHMTEAELIFTAQAELSTRQIAENTDATGMAANKSAASRRRYCQAGTPSARGPDRPASSVWRQLLGTAREEGVEATSQGLMRAR